eukprot:TRINITY_DN18137_c0_g1_i1.p1 TRINITY_DN18137_c0_g1~~TRINITY_DN18137_c0_g1_i1.p1  ORF type:complete len:378 (+),score=133.21 TRINITY_DN18137_c0_g1_i1:64-1197(+)
MVLVVLAKEEWQNDEEVSACVGCAKPFNFARRKHHCRFCGLIFCDACTKGREMNLRACTPCIEKGSITNTPPHPGQDTSMDGIAETPNTDADASPRDDNGVKSSSREDSPGHDNSKDLSMDFETPMKSPSPPYTPKAMSPKTPVTPMYKPGTDPHLLEEIQLHRARIAVLEGQIAQLMPELTQVKQGFSNACTNLVKMTEEKRRTEQEESEKVTRKQAILRRAREEAMSDRAARKAAFEKREHHSPSCEICKFEYSFTQREHHCRVCFRSVCSVCAPKDAELRRCDWCVTRDMLSYDEFRERLLATSVSEALTWMTIFDASSIKIWEATVYPSPPPSAKGSPDTHNISPILTPAQAALAGSSTSIARADSAVASEHT